MPEISFPAGAHQVRGYLAVPSGAGPWPGVVMLQDALGLNDDLRRTADHMAANGYLVLAPDLYSGASRIRCIEQTMRTLILGRGPALDRIDAAREFLADHADSTGRTAVIGFCMGGMFAVLAASGFDAAAPNYGLPLRNMDEVLATSCPMVGSFASKDYLISPDRVRRATARLDQLGTPHDMKIYPDATHSFFQQPVGATGAIFRVLGLRHDPAACADAWDRIFTFFGKHLAQPA